MENNSNQEIARPGAPVTSKSVVLAIAIMSNFLTPFMFSSVNIALPTIQSKLHMNAISLNWVVSAYLVAAATFLVPFGRVSDIYGRKRIFRIGIVIDAVASILCAFITLGRMADIFSAFCKGSAAR